MRVSLRPVLAALAVGAACAGALAAAGPAAAAAAGPVAPAGPTGDRVVQLVTGDTVRLHPAGGGRTAVEVATVAHSGLGAQWSQLSVAGHLTVVPAVVRPYLGRVLDPALFDVTAPSSATSVDVTFPAGHPAAVPGLTVTSSTATHQYGTLDAAGARTFGAALLARAGDVARGAAPTSVFGASRIARAGSVTPVTPAFPQVTLVVKALDATGKPGGFGIVGLVNTDDPRRYVGFVFLDDGIARVSVPLGHYGAMTDVSTYDVRTQTSDDAIVTVPDFTVGNDLQQLVLDSRTATSVLSVSTPRPAGLQGLDVEYDRLVGAGGFSSSISVGPGGRVRVAPAPAPVRGTVDLLAHWNLGSTPAQGLPYRYDAAFDDSGALEADQSHQVDATRTATLDAHYAVATPPTTAFFGRTPVYPFQTFIFVFLPAQPAPLARTEYLSAPPSATWFDSYVGAATDVNPFNGIVDDGPRVYAGGTRQSVDWMRGPLAPGVVEPTNGATFFVSNSCRTATSMTVAMAPFVDSTPGHAGQIVAPDDQTNVATFTLARDGTTLLRRRNTVGALVPVPAARSVYTATVETDAAATGFTTSTHAVTTWTFPSAATGGNPLPDGWYCPAGEDATVLPVLRATWSIPTDLTGVLPLGTQSLDVTVTPAAGAPAARVGGVTVATSLDGGRTFTDAPVQALGANRFRAQVTSTAAQGGRSVTLRVTGSTAAGSAITETVSNAYTLAGS